LIKLGQFLSARVDVLPVEITNELQGLQDEVPPVDPFVLRQILDTEFESLDNHFYEVEMAPLAAASLGQTVRGWLLNPEGERGAAVVLKVLRPDIESIVRTDLEALRVVAPILMRYGPIRRRADVPALLEEFAETLWEELDYKAEVYNAKRFKTMFLHEPRVYIPKVYEELCTERVLVLENVENLKINEVEEIKALGINVRQVAEQLIEVYLYQIFKAGFFHADPHPGNIFIRPRGEPLSEEDRLAGMERPFQIIFIDFGMVGRLSPEFKNNLAQVLIGIVQSDARTVINAYDRMGFFLPGTDLERIVQAQATIMERIEGRNLRELSNPDPAEMQQIGNEFRDVLFDFPFQVPQDFIYLGRALGILSGIASSLYPDVNPWYQVERFGLEMINAQRPNIELNRESFLQLAERIRPYLGLPAQVQRVVRAAENGRLRVQSTDPIANRRLERIERRLNFLNWSIIGAAGLLSGTLIYLNRQNKEGQNGHLNGSNGHKGEE
ncbi:MAG: AarF/ABC1/UbiB kinase family protein, partial [Anaerolineales bacterium]|nr:AarF/ABC1/UbiB kinase family protein [Anaerolineales bacterium]